MCLQALISGGQLDVKFSLDIGNAQLGSPESVISVITFFQKHLERSDSEIGRLIIYESIQALMLTTFQYEGDIRLKSVQMALGITSLRQDANMPQYVQKVLDDLESLYKSEAYSMETKSDGVDDVPTGCCRRPAAMAWRFRPSLFVLGLFLILILDLRMLLR
ncbi:hypothetical protein V498_02179 [Pseudogymnoascus sp. VKM F-4517 (FW-2822)]|nr:hypothetical protein V498_02179 [Pseudogymnoascus sp. VKM F-4517 (FW-2822)]